MVKIEAGKSITARDLLRHLQSLSPEELDLPPRFLDEWDFRWEVEIVETKPGQPLILRAKKEG